MANISEIESYHSAPVQEIMGTIPSWITRWGITVISAVLVLLIIGCCIIRFPQTISSTISISKANPPSKLEARYTGILDTITVNNGQIVEQGELIALLKTPAVYKDIMKVKSFTDSIRLLSLSDIVEDDIFNKTLMLGSVQDKWTEICGLVKEYKLYQQLDQTGKKKELLSEQIQQNKEYNSILKHQRGLLEEDTSLQLLAMQRDSVLWRGGFSAQAEYEASRQVYISKLNNLASFDAMIESASLNSITLEQGLYELDIQRNKEEDQFKVRYSRAVTEIESFIESWIDTYAIIAPFRGVVSLHDFWAVGQHVNTGDVLASVVPDFESEVEGRMKVTSVGFGKITTGQTVNVRLNGFPYIEFGILKGKISKISQVPEKLPDGSIVYNVEVYFPNGLVSTYNKPLPFIQDMDGEAEIITVDQRLIELFIKPIKSLFYNN